MAFCWCGVKGANPYQALKRLLIQNGILKNDFGLSQSIIAQKQIAPSTHLVQLSAHELQSLQIQQGIPFQDFKGESAAPFTPKSILVVSKNSQEDAHLATLTDVERTLRLLGIQFQIINLSEIRPEHFCEKDLIVPVGGDGTFLRAAHFANSSTLFMGVVSDPQTTTTNPLGSWGHYLPLTAFHLENALNQMSRGAFTIAQLSRLFSQLRKGEITNTLELALNEIFINEADSSHSARYVLSVDGLTEVMSDSGLLISTGAGSSANAWISNTGGVSFDAGSNLLQFKAREPRQFQKDGCPNNLLHGFALQLQVVSAMHHAPRVNIDGASKAHSFPLGATLTITIGTPLAFTGFPSLACRDMAEPQRPVAEITTQATEQYLTSDQIQEIDRLPICSTVLAGEKRQILLLQAAPAMDELRIMRILKTGGMPLSAQDILCKATIDNPTLLFPTAQIASLPAVARDVVFTLYTYGLRVVEYAGVITEWDSSIDKNVWAASIDTIAFIRALLDHHLLGDRITSAAEVGTGGGAIAKALALYCPSLKDLIITDIEKKALECALRNLQPFLASLNPHSILGKGISQIGKVDLLAVNPPYLPEKNISGEVDQYRGLSLMEEILREGKEHLNPGGSVVINYSSCAAEEFGIWAKKYGWNMAD